MQSMIVRRKEYFGHKIISSTSRFSNMGSHGKDVMEKEDDYEEYDHVVDYLNFYPSLYLCAANLNVIQEF